MSNQFLRQLRETNERNHMQLLAAQSALHEAKAMFDASNETLVNALLYFEGVENV